MNDIPLRADCARCAALCCVALAFDRSDQFALDKPAGQACPHLGARGACSIHASRAEKGFRGCVAFDCLGAGQRVTQELFDGRSWIEEPSLLAPMSRAFQVLLRSHEYLLLLRQAESLDLSASERSVVVDLEVALRDAGASARTLDDLKPAIDAFLATLRRHVEAASNY